MKMYGIVIILTFFAYSEEAQISNYKDLMLSVGSLENSKKVVSIDELIKDYELKFWDDDQKDMNLEELENFLGYMWTIATVGFFYHDVEQTNGIGIKKADLTNGTEYKLDFHYLPRYVPDSIANNVPKRTDESIYHAVLRITGSGEKAGRDVTTLTEWIEDGGNKVKALKVLNDKMQSFWDMLDENVSITKLDYGVRFEWVLEVPDQLFQRTPQPLFNIELTIGACPKPKPIFTC